VSSLDENVGDVLRALRESGLEGDTRVLYTSDHGDNAGARGLWGKSTFYEESAACRSSSPVPALTAVALVGNAGVAHRLRADDPRGHRMPVERTTASHRYASLFAVAQGATPARAGDLRVSRDRLDRGRLHVALSPVEVLPLLCAILRSSSISSPIPRNCVDVRRRRELRRHSRRKASGIACELDPAKCDARAKRRPAYRCSRLRRSRDAALARGDLGFTPAARHRAGNE
jgi:choline-sulfatase